MVEAQNFYKKSAKIKKNPSKLHYYYSTLVYLLIKLLNMIDTPNMYR